MSFFAKIWFFLRVLLMRRERRERREQVVYNLKAWERAINSVPLPSEVDGSPSDLVYYRYLRHDSFDWLTARLADEYPVSPRDLKNFVDEWASTIARLRGGVSGYNIADNIVPVLERAREDGWTDSELHHRMYQAVRAFVAAMSIAEPPTLDLSGLKSTR